MNVKTDMTIRLMRWLCSGSAESDEHRTAHLAHLEEFIGRGDYRVPALDIVDAILANAPLSRQSWEDAVVFPPACRRPERKGAYLTR